MKRFLFLLPFVLLVGYLFGEVIVPTTKPYPNPAPTSGVTPGGTIRVTSPINPTLYNSTFPVVWNDFVGGAPKHVQSLADRGNINTNFLSEGTLCWVKDTGHMYQLLGSLTTWTDLGAPTAWGGGGAGALWYDTVADIRSIALPSGNAVAKLAHHTEQDAPQGGDFLWHAGLVTTDDGVDNIECTASALSGTWIRQ